MHPAARFLAGFLLFGSILFAARLSAQSSAALPYPSKDTPQAIDRGSFSLQSASPISVTIALSLRNLSQAEALLSSINTPGNPQFHQYLSSQQFAAQFAPAPADVAKVIAALAKYGLTARQTTSTTLNVTGLAASFERAFSVSLHSYEVPARGNAAGYTFHAPLTQATIPSEISDAVAGVVGLDSRPALHPQHTFAPSSVGSAKGTAPSGDPFGSLTVTDFAKYYDVEPLYSRGITGKGQTLGIMTFANLTPSDAFAYWSALGLSVNPKRITIVNVDGGSGPPSDASGSDETTLDVEQSGGIATGANIIVYEAPNTNQGSVDIYAQAIEANKAQSLSISWGFWEWYQNLENSPVTDPTTGKTVGITQATHELLLRAAIQGIAIFATSGDSGAYDADRDFADCYPTYCSNPLTVDYPGSDTLITTGGGTTLPGVQTYGTLTIDVPHERVWGWDYLEPLCVAQGTPDPIACGIFPGGGGGGVSIMFPVPLDQILLSGVQRSQPGQNWNINPAYAALFGVVNTSYKLPANYAGRNLPDVSFNADPQTGYVIYYTSDVNGFEFLHGGGTSFVAPQLNGVTSLLGQYLDRRLGLLNYPLYLLAVTGQAYSGSHPPLHAIAYGDNWFYKGSNGYNPGAGLGTIDVWNFASVLRGPF